MWTAINGAWNLTDDSDRPEWRWLTVASLVLNLMAWMWLLKKGILTDWLKQLNASKWVNALLAIPILLNLALIWLRLVDVIPSIMSREVRGVSESTKAFSQGLQKSVLGSVVGLNPKGAMIGQAIQQKVGQRLRSASPSSSPSPSASGPSASGPSLKGPSLKDVQVHATQSNTGDVDA